MFRAEHQSILARLRLQHVAGQRLVFLHERRDAIENWLIRVRPGLAPPVDTADGAEVERLEHAPQRRPRRLEVLRVGRDVPGDGRPDLSEPLQQLQVVHGALVGPGLSVTGPQALSVVLSCLQLVLQLNTLLAPVVGVQLAVLVVTADTGETFTRLRLITLSRRDQISEQGLLMIGAGL